MSATYHRVRQGRMGLFLSQRERVIVAYTYEGKILHADCAARRIFIPLGIDEDPIAALDAEADSFALDPDNTGGYLPQRLYRGDRTEQIAVCNYCGGSIKLNPPTRKA